LAVNLYEGMFVVDAARGGSDFPALVRHIADILTRNEARIERIEKWDERKLAYPIENAKRGIYVLTYFHMDGSAIAELRHMVRLSEDLLRALFLRKERMDPVQGQLYNAEGEEVEAPPAEPAGAPVLSKEPAEGAAESPEDAEADEAAEPEPQEEEPGPEPAAEPVEPDGEDPQAPAAP